MTVGPDLRLGIAAADEWIVGRHAAVEIQAHDFAEVAVQILRVHARFGHGALTQRQEQFAVRREHDARAEVQIGFERRHLPENHLDLLDAGFVGAEHALGQRGAVALVTPRFGIAPVDGAIVRELRIECDVEQPALAFEEHFRQAFQWRRQFSILADDAQIALSLGDQDALIGQEFECPAAFDILGDLGDVELEIALQTADASLAFERGLEVLAVRLACFQRCARLTRRSGLRRVLGLCGGRGSFARAGGAHCKNGETRGRVQER